LPSEDVRMGGWHIRVTEVCGGVLFELKPFQYPRGKRRFKEMGKHVSHLNAKRGAEGGEARSELGKKEKFANGLTVTYLIGGGMGLEDYSENESGQVSRQKGILSSHNNPVQKGRGKREKVDSAQAEMVAGSGNEKIGVWKERGENIGGGGGEIGGCNRREWKGEKFIP